MAEPTPPPAGGKPKKKGVPTWYYIAGAGALLVAYYAYAKSQANKTAAASSTPAAGTSSGAGTATGSYGNAGDLAALAPYLNAANSSSQSTPTSGVIPTGETLQSGGYGPPAGSTSVPDVNGNSYSLVPSASISNLINAGNTLYYQPSPGVFSPINNGESGITGWPTGAPIFIKSSASGASAPGAS